MISSNKWGARKLSYATYFENLKSWGDYNKVIGAKSGTVNRGIGRPKLTVSVKLVKSLLFAVGVVIYQNDGKDVYFAELLSDFMCMRFY